MVQSSSHQPPAINIQTEAKVQKLIPNRTGSVQKVSESTPNQHVPEVTQLSIMGLPIIHLSIPQENPPWTLLLKMGIAPLVAELTPQAILRWEDHLIPFELERSNQRSLGTRDCDTGLSHPT